MVIFSPSLLSSPVGWQGGRAGQGGGPCLPACLAPSATSLLPLLGQIGQPRCVCDVRMRGILCWRQCVSRWWRFCGTLAAAALTAAPCLPPTTRPPHTCPTTATPAARCPPCLAAMPQHPTAPTGATCHYRATPAFCPYSGSSASYPASHRLGGFGLLPVNTTRLGAAGIYSHAGIVRRFLLLPLPPVTPYRSLRDVTVCRSRCLLFTFLTACAAFCQPRGHCLYSTFNETTVVC